MKERHRRIDLFIGVANAGIACIWLFAAGLQLNSAKINKENSEYFEGIDRPALSQQYENQANAHSALATTNIILAVYCASVAAGVALKRENLDQAVK